MTAIATPRQSVVFGREQPVRCEDMAGMPGSGRASLYRPFPIFLVTGANCKQRRPLGDKVVLRGGGFYSDYGSVRSTLRYGGLPDLLTMRSACAAPIPENVLAGFFPKRD